MMHYYSEKQDSPLRPISFETILRGHRIVINSGSGVFSKDRVDPGSRLLAENVEVTEGQRVLDMGCGYGIIGVTIAKSVPGSEVVMTDVNTRAVGLAKKNCKENSVNITVLQGTLYEKIEGKFDVILTNPPQNAGKDICLAMIDGAKERLNQGGKFYFVARHKKGGKSLSEHMEEFYGNLDIIKKKGGFRVYMSRVN